MERMFDSVKGSDQGRKPYWSGGRKPFIRVMVIPFKAGKKI
jgi:hypothetical protein